MTGAVAATDLPPWYRPRYACRPFYGMAYEVNL